MVVKALHTRDVNAILGVVKMTLCPPPHNQTEGEVNGFIPIV